MSSFNSKAPYPIVGIQLGGQKCVLVDNEGEIVRTDTGSTSIPLLVSFNGKSRYCGDEALAQSATDTLPLIVLAGKTASEANSSPLSYHRRIKFIEENSKLVAEIMYCNELKTFSVPQLLAISLSKMYQRILKVYGPDTHLVFPTIPGGCKKFEKAIRDSCYIAGIDLKKVTTMDPVDCLIATYCRKLQALRPSDRSALNGKKGLLIEVGHTQTTIVVVSIDSDGPSKVCFSHSDSIGALYFDLLLFEHFSKIVQDKHCAKIVPGSKQGQRLLGGCERIRKLLSQLPESSITVENMTDNGDVNFTMRRDDFANVCKDILGKFKDLITSTLSNAGVSLPLNNDNEIGAVEILGGGVRMQIVQAVIFDIVGKDTHLGAKFDDGSIALGGALLATAASSNATESTDDKLKEYEGIGLSDSELDAARQLETSMLATDAEIGAILSARNEIEAYILEMRSAPRQKHGNLIESTKLNQLLDDAENWMWDNPDASLDELNEKHSTLKLSINTICGAYLAAKEEERLAAEKALETESARAAAERAANGEEDDDDKDFRKLKKADRMRLVVKNKEEGNELFKGGIWKNACARYHKALSHCAKFFDLSKEDEEEVRQMKLTLYLNLASCYIKLQNYDQTFRNCEDALNIDPVNVKAIFRRGSAYEGKKEFEKALVDFKKCQEINIKEDPLVTKGIDRLKKEISKEKNKEKAMW